MNKNSPIGIFDSGVGGLTILKEVHKLMPEEDLIYFGDSAHIPYGTKSKEAIIRYSLDIAHFLESHKVKLIIIACNTASALALPTLEKKIKTKVLGVIQPASKKANEITKNGKIALIATQATIKSNSYKKTLLKINKQLKVSQFACPLFVPLIEDNTLLEEILPILLEKHLTQIKQSGVDTLILGCTHYPLIKKQIAEFLGDKIALIDSAQNTALIAKNYLQKKDLLKEKQGNKKSKIEVFTSEGPKHFEELAKKILKQKNIKARLVK